jgi:hypothetical protein
MVIAVSCEKDRVELQTGQKIVLSPFDNYILRNCRYAESGTNYFGYKCVWGFTETCPKHISCRPLLDDNGQKIPMEMAHPVLVGWGFTEEEISQWIEDLEFLNDTTPESITNRYEFYYHLWNSGITFHPDTIIARMEN